MLDKIRSFTEEKITVDIFKNINGMVSQQEVNEFYQSVFNKDINKILEIIDKINETGYDFKNFIERVMLLTRDNIVDYYVNKKEILGSINQNVELVTVLNDVLNRLKDAINPMVIVQVYILKFIEAREPLEIKQNDEKEEEIIAREIILDEKSEKKETKVKKNVAKEQKVEENKDNKPSIIVNEEVKNIRINNAMATANLTYKKELSKVWDRLNDYFMDNKYSKVAQLLSDTTPMVVGTEYLILTSTSDGITDNVYANLNQIEDFINNIYHLMKIVVVSNEEFESVKKKYIEDKNNNIVYQVQEEYGKLVNESNSLINQALDLFGTDMVDIE